MVACEGVSSGRVLVITGEDVEALVEFLCAQGYEVLRSGGARDGFAMACKSTPDCIICDVVLPDIDGFWVARRVRTEPTSVATVPFLFLTTQEEREAMVQGLHVGADVYLCKPFSNEELAAQVEALIEMARRLRARRDSYVDGPSSVGAAFKGDLAQMSLATVLMMIEMERRRGVLKVVTTGGAAALLGIAETGFVSSQLAGVERPVVEVLRAVLKWKVGRFWFRPSMESTAGPGAPRGSIGAVLLESIQLDDEANNIAGPEESVQFDEIPVASPMPALSAAPKPVVILPAPLAVTPIGPIVPPPRPRPPRPVSTAASPSAPRRAAPNVAPPPLPATRRAAVATAKEAKAPKAPREATLVSEAKAPREATLGEAKAAPREATLVSEAKPLKAAKPVKSKADAEEEFLWEAEPEEIEIDVELTDPPASVRGKRQG